MQALVSRAADQPLAWAELPDRPLRPDEIRVAVRAVSVNPVDWKMRSLSLLGFAQRLVGPGGPLVVGVDFAGEVRELGAEVSGLQVGDRVVGGTDFSRRQRGSYARTVQVRSDQVALLPPTVSFTAAACLPVAGVTARLALVDHGAIDRKPAPRALILGATGGVGHLAIQIARHLGAEVVGVASKKNLPLVERLGARPIDYGAGEALAQAAAHGPYDVIVDAVGSSSYPIPRALPLLKEGGCHVLVMPRPADYLRLAFQGRVRTVLGRISGAALEPLVAQLAAGRLEPVVAQELPLGEAERAHELSRGGRVVGKLVLIAD